MKKIITTVALIAMSIMSLVSCQKGIEATKGVGTHKVHFTVDLAEATKTVLDGKTVNWVDNADAALFHVFENGVEAAPGNLEVVFEDGIADVIAEFEDTEATECTYTAFVASHNSNNNPCVPREQTATATSYDPSADLLIAEPVVFSNNQNSTVDIKFRFARLVSINKMTLKGILAGEKISKVVLNGSRALVGSYDPKKDYAYTGTDKLLTINTTSDVVYFVTSAVTDVTPTIEVTTDKAVYTKTFAKPIDFVANELHSFTVTFSEKDRKTAETSYKLVTSVSELAEGDIVVLGCAAKSTAAGIMGTTAYLSAVDATITDGILKSAAAVEITLGKDGNNWTLTSSEGVIGATAAKKLAIGKGTKTWTIAIADGAATVASTNSSYGRFLYNVNSPRFLNYTSDISVSMLLPELYKKNN
ncbi:MAG: hypothetical protein KBS80_01770 [Bacteroidales bacterium]|nr:hypothetical protein [Candidatus Cryptobacteroides choladohippi]